MSAQADQRGQRTASPGATRHSRNNYDATQPCETSNIIDVRPLTRHSAGYGLGVNCRYGIFGNVHVVQRQNCAFGDVALQSNAMCKADG